MKNRHGKDGMWEVSGWSRENGRCKDQLADELDCSRPVGVPLLSFQETTQLLFREKQLQSVSNLSLVSL